MSKMEEIIIKELEVGGPCWYISGLDGYREPLIGHGTVVRIGDRITVRKASGFEDSVPHRFAAASLHDLRLAVFNYTSRIDRMADRAILRAQRREMEGGYHEQLDRLAETISKTIILDKTEAE